MGQGVDGDRLAFVGVVDKLGDVAVGVRDLRDIAHAVVEGRRPVAQGIDGETMFDP